MSYFKRSLIFALSALLILAPPAAYANTSIGGWTALDILTAGATNTINATKGAGASALRSAVAIAPSALKVGGYLIRGGGAAALLLAVPQILGDGVDYVLDPANNTLKYKVPAVAVGGAYSVSGYPATASSSYELACQAYVNVVNASNASVGNESDLKYDFVSGNQCYFQYKQYANYPYRSMNVSISYDSAYSPPADNWQSIPISDVAAQVIANAEAGHAPSQEAVKAVALEGFAAGEHDAALDAAAVPDTGVENPPDTTNPDAPAEPVPFDPSSILSALAGLKAMLAGILSSITGLSDFFKADPDPVTESTDVVVDAPVTDFETDKTYITFAGSCPPNYTASMSIMGNTVPFSFDYAPICTVMSALKPFIVGAGYLTAAYIIAGHSRGSRD